jgi:hypothetical protein
MSTEIQRSLYLALKSKYESEINQARVTLLIYFSNSVGIGEHHQHLEEMDKLLGSISDTEDKLKSLSKHFHHLENNS